MENINLSPEQIEAIADAYAAKKRERWTKVTVEISFFKFYFYFILSLIITQLLFNQIPFLND